MDEIIEAEVMVEQQVKSKERVKDHGEVFTNKREVNAMLDLVKDESYRVDSRFLEPACGTGNFLVAILERKLETVVKAGLVDQVDFEKQVFIAVASIYAIDIQADNCVESRDRLYKIVERVYGEVYPDSQDDQFMEVIKYILETNVILGNGLSGLQVDPDNQEDLAGQLIQFTEFTFDRYDVIRKDFTMNGMLKHNQDIEEDKKRDTKFIGSFLDAITPKETRELKPINSAEPIYFKDIYRNI